MKLFAALAVVTARERTSFNVGSSNNESQFSLVSDGSGNTLEVVNELPIEQYQKKQENEGNDIFYPKRLLKHLASQGMDVTNMKPSITAGGDAVRSNLDPERAAVSWHTKWFKKGEHPVTGEEVILLEWIFEQDFPNDPDIPEDRPEVQQKEWVRALVNDMNEDNSCVYLKEMSRDPNSPDFIDSTKGEDYPYGIVVAHHHGGEAGCWSNVGICPGCSTPFEHGYDVPSTWQVINLSQSCGYLSDERPVKHEFLHALGFLHEQSRPDRASFLDVDTSDLDAQWAAQYNLMSTSQWLDTQHPYEAISVMHYGSYLGATLVMTYKDGTAFSSGRKMTTTDALQLDAMYCEDMPQYQRKATIACPTVDKFGFNRPVFSDRLCNNLKDCTNGEDEGTIAACAPYGTNTANGCCEEYVVNGAHCTLTATPAPNGGGRDSWECPDSGRYVFHWGGHWVVSSNSAMDSGSGIYSYITVDDQCPPPVFTEGNGYEVTCKVAGVLLTGTACDGDPCGGNAECFLTDDGHSCQCHEGYELDNGVCVEIVLVDECTEGTHNCAENASCIDNTSGFTCICPEGTLGDGTVCESPYECCKTINIDTDDVTNNADHLICQYEYTQSLDGYYYYHCSGNPDFVDTAWASNGDIGLLYDGAFGLQYYIHTPRRTDGEVLEFLSGYGQQLASSDFTNQQVKKCPDVSLQFDLGGAATATCAEFFPSGFCADMTCPDNSICTNGQTEGTCACRPGYVFSDQTETVCQEKVNECTEQTHNCHALAFCTDTDLGFGCICDDGYDGDGVTECNIVCVAGTEPNQAGNLCVDIDECADGPCDANFDCVNGNNEFTCNCDTSKYDLVGAVCQDKNECNDPSVNCPSGSTCENTVGSFECQCDEGFSEVGIALSPTEIVCDADECLTENCATNASCENTVGSFECSCDAGWEAAGAFLNPLDLTCVDTDECATGTHTCGNFLCIDNDGSFECDFNTPVIDCGTACPAETVASLNIQNAPAGEAVATCTKAGWETGKNSEWTLHCDANQNGIVDAGETVQENSLMGKKCKISAKIDCGGVAPPDTSCDFLAEVQAANPDAIVTCVEDLGKQEHMQCEDADGNVLSTSTGKKKVLLKWVVASCGGNGGGGNTDCNFLANVQAANPDVVVTCIADNGKIEHMSCADQDGNVLSTFEGKSKKLMKWVVSSECSTGGGGGGGGGGGNPTCFCETETANFVDIQCIATNTWSCTDTNGMTIQFDTPKAKKCNKVASKSTCARNAKKEANKNNKKKGK